MAFCNALIRCLAAAALLHGAFASLAAEPESTRFNQAALDQARIHQSRGDQVPAGYVVDRSLLSYAHTLPAAFDAALAALDEHDRWLDVGAGEGQAVLDYYAPRFDAMHPLLPPRRKARAVALSIEDRRTPRWAATAAQLADGRIRYLSGRTLSEYGRDELGRFRLITDVAGGFSYTRDLSRYLEAVLAALEVDGEFFTMLSDVRTAQGGRRPYFDPDAYLTEIARADGSSADICGWLRQISCVEVRCAEKSGWQPPVSTFHLRKTCEHTAVPRLLPESFEAGTPPTRRFRAAR